MRLIIIILIALSCNYDDNVHSVKDFYEQQQDEECESKKAFAYPQIHKCLISSQESKLHYNNLLKQVKDSQQSTSIGNTEFEGKYEKHNLQHDLKENKRYYFIIEPEISSNHQIRLFKECLNERLQSKIEGCIYALNSSIELKDIGMLGCEYGSIVCGRKGSVVVVRGCVVGMGKGNEAGAFDLCGCIGVLTNITLNGWRRWGEIYSGRLFGGKDYGREKSGGEENGGEGERGRGRGREGDGYGDGEGIEGSISVSESHFSSFCVSSAPFLSSPSIPLISLSHLTFFNISTANDACSPSTTTSTQTSCLMSSCSFSSICDAYDGGIVPSLNNPMASLSVSNTSFVGCCRTRNVECIGTLDGKLTPDRQNITDNGANTFTWCEWNGSRTTGESDSWADGASSGGAIFMYGQSSATVSVSHCLFNNCFAYSRGGGIMCHTIKSVRIENNVFNACTAQNQYGGGMYVSSVSTCARISGCEFQNCKAVYDGGGLRLDNFQVSGTGCIEAENGGGESACVFDCSFTSCSLTNNGGGGMFCKTVPAAQFKMRSIQFISCSAFREGGGLCLHPNRATAPNDGIYCYFLFFHECKCRTTSNPYGHDVMYYDYYNAISTSDNPFHECYTTNADDKRVCYGYNYSNAGAWTYDQTSKKDWLKDKTIYVLVNGSDGYELCGANTTFACKTVKKAFEMCEVQISLAITLMEGNHESETTTIDIGSKKISVIGIGKDKSSIGTGALSSVGTLFSVSTGHLVMSHLKVDCNSNINPSSSVVVASDGGGSLSLEDVVITTSISSGNYVMSSSVFVVPLSQLLMTDVEIINMNVSKPLFSEPNQSPSSSSSSSLSSSLSSALYLTATASGDSMLANVKVTNVKLTEGDGVVVAKSVKAGETFVVKNVTIEDCECKDGSGGGIKVELKSSSKLQVGTSSAPVNEATKFNRCNCSGNGGGIMVNLADGPHDFSIVSVDFTGCTAKSGGNYVFVNGGDSENWGITTEKLKGIQGISSLKELVGYDTDDTTMGQFPLNVFLDSHTGAAHVGKKKDGVLGRYDSWFCGFDYYTCATITHTAQARFSGGNKNIELDPEFVLAEKVAMDDANEWEISCATKGTAIEVKVPTTFESAEFLIDVQSRCSIKKIKFSIPSALSSASAMISAHSPSFNITDCSVASSPDSAVGQSIGYSFVNALSGKLRMEQFENREGLTFDGHSLVEFVAGVSVVYFKGCNIANVRKINGDGGLIKGAVGTQYGEGEGKVGIVVIETCTVINCNCQGTSQEIGKGGGICVSLDGDGSVVVNGTSTIDGCEAKNNGGGGTKGRGGGMMLTMASPNCKMEIAENVKFSSTSSSLNDAQYGKDMFVCCDSTILLGTKVNANSFKFFDKSAIPSDELKFCGSEDGKDEKVTPLFVYLFSIGSKLTVDGSGSMAYDHNSCGFEKFGCQSIDYCVTSRVKENMQAVEVSSESSIKSEMKVLSFDVSLTGKAVTAGKKMKVDVKDGGEINQNGLIECTKSFEMTNLAFVMNKVINGRRTAFVHSSSSTITITSCSVSFENSPLTEEKIGYNILNIEGGELIVDGLMMEIATTLTTNGKSPITMTNGEKLDIKNSRVSGVTVEDGSGEGRGCIGAAIKEGGSAVVDNCSISTTCTGGSGMKGGGMMISVEDRGSLEIKSATFTGCQVPMEDSLQKGRGMGGGMFVSLADTMGSFVLEGVTFSECNAWKGKKVFISGNELDEVMSNEQLKWGLSASDEKSLDELCGWERKTTGENGYVIPLVVYLWDNWSEKGYLSKEKGGDFSGCGFSEAPCSSIDHLISLRYPTLGKGESQISIGDSGLLSHPISFLSSLPTSPDSEAPAVVIKGTKKGTSVTITDEDGNAVSSGAMISSNVSLSFFNLSFIKPIITANHAVFIESSGTNTVLFVSNCSFGSLVGLAESFACCLIKVNGGSAEIEKCSMNLISDLKGFIAFSPSATQVTIQNVNISSATLTANSLISMTEEENQMNGNENTHLNGNKPVLKVVYCSFETIKNEGSSASVIELGSFENAIDCTTEDCTMSACRSDLNTEGGGMKVVLKSEESVLKVNGSTFSTCRCSMESGRGGGLFIDGADTNVVYDNESQIPSLNLRIVNTLFRLNEAFAGKDIFIKCHSILDQINETLFSLNYNQESLATNNSICGSDLKGNTDMDVIPRITFFKGFQVFLNGSGEDGRRCGAQGNPCSSINEAIDHIEQGVMNAILIDGEGVVSGECVIGDLYVNSYKKTQAIVKLKLDIAKSAEKDCIMEFINESAVERCSFEFEDTFEASHSYIMKVKNGSMEIQKCEFYSSATAEDMKLNSSVVSVESGELRIFDSAFRDLHAAGSVLLFNRESNVTLLETSISNIKSEGDVVSVGGKAKVVMKIMTIENVSVASERCVVAMEDAEQEVSVLNCSFEKSANSVEKGSMMQIRRSKEVKVEICVFDGEKEEKEAEAVNGEQERVEKLCKWSGSLIDIENSNVEMKETTIRNSKVGGLWVSGGSVKIENSKFEDNNPSIEGYGSARRNVICTGNCELSVASVKGGNGVLPNTSLWILDEGCQLGGIASERGSSYFIPVLEEVKNTTQASGSMDLSIRGKLLLPCNLSLKISMKDGEVERIQTQKIEENECASENEVHSVISSDIVKTIENKTEVSMSILFGKGMLSSTNTLVVINKTVPPSSGDDRISEGGNKNNNGNLNMIEWSLFAFIGCIVIVAILLFVIVVMAVVQRRKLWEAEKKVEKERLENEQIIQKMERRRVENGIGNFEMSEMPSTLLEGMTSQIPLLIDNDEVLPEPPPMTDEELNENDLPDLESQLPFSEDTSVSLVSQSHSFNVISAKKPFREKEKKNIKTLYSMIHSVQGNFTLGTRAMDVVDGKEVVLAVARLFQHLISIGDERVKMMARQLCPYSIFVDEGSYEIFVLTEELEDEKQNDELRRWKAPELNSENEDDEEEVGDEGIGKAVVFTLGLILHETTTGEVSLSECDAEEAQEMMRDGVRPLTEGIEGEDLVEFIEKMWADEPNDRPRLAEVKRRMKEIMRDEVS
ncbi:uncharacterized protein MONOS_11695 [Monocercomonoides exilis]|uniref:uncharacterized protein n=1 Tax=Monocercomonoides exilis TaxID=2049356 RepID=UPI00355AB404|nr:hypothetical protein MONOS_11695 [Monocercomonoides exilis]|eukprot:MONOS_11695.1-p1 / transcript=MONOS_11695.1 / gene=MONOS_11695 / organism=Monocercomonoides_exilis_PA203 / gene_product=unspecified product / transcript_product=unspecified product / location=Mono_scaffold00602:28851-37955(+) / protein_length=3035 / sequence_SO=supercontig / SO=protein_coding / is_pseudo=false